MEASAQRSAKRTEADHRRIGAPQSLFFVVSWDDYRRRRWATFFGEVLSNELRHLVCQYYKQLKIRVHWKKNKTNMNE